MCVKIAERFAHYSLGRVPSVPALKILTATISSVVQLLLDLTVVVG